MVDDDGRSLVRQGVMFARYLIGTAPTDYVVAKYTAAHEKSDIAFDALGNALDAHGDALDAVLLRVACIAPAATALADTYARFTRPAGTLRCKLVLLAAILECAPPSYTAFESPPASSSTVVIARVMLRGTVFALILVAAILLLGPVHLWLRVTGTTQRRPASAPAGR
jgi:hypothetical protein